MFLDSISHTIRPKLRFSSFRKNAVSLSALIQFREPDKTNVPNSDSGAGTLRSIASDGMGIERRIRHRGTTIIPETIMQQEIEIAGPKTTEQKFSIARVAQVIGVHPATVSRLMDSGKLGYYQIGTRRIVGQTHLEQYLLLAERKAKAPAVH
jgi:excisionase family DNA binding protein